MTPPGRAAGTPSTLEMRCQEGLLPSPPSFYCTAHAPQVHDPVSFLQTSGAARGRAPGPPWEAASRQNQLIYVLRAEARLHAHQPTYKWPLCV